MDCIDTLGHVKDNLVIIGVALDYETDSHIVDAIKKAHLADTEIYYGYYSPDDKSLAEDLNEKDCLRYPDSPSMPRIYDFPIGADVSFKSSPRLS